MMLGKRVLAWRGPEKDLCGKVIRVDGVYHCYVQWDDGTESHCETSALVSLEWPWAQKKTAWNPGDPILTDDGMMYPKE